MSRRRSAASAASVAFFVSAALGGLEPGCAPPRTCEQPLSSALWSATENAWACRHTTTCGQDVYVISCDGDGDCVCEVDGDDLGSCALGDARCGSAIDAAQELFADCCGAELLFQEAR